MPHQHTSTPLIENQMDFFLVLSDVSLVAKPSPLPNQRTTETKIDIRFAYFWLEFLRFFFAFLNKIWMQFDFIDELPDTTKLQRLSVVVTIIESEMKLKRKEKIEREIFLWDFLLVDRPSSTWSCWWSWSRFDKHLWFASKQTNITHYDFIYRRHFDLKKCVRKPTCDRKKKNRRRRRDAKNYCIRNFYLTSFLHHLAASWRTWFAYAWFRHWATMEMIHKTLTTNAFVCRAAELQSCDGDFWH